MEQENQGLCAVKSGDQSSRVDTRMHPVALTDGLRTDTETPLGSQHTAQKCVLVEARNEVHSHKLTSVS